MSVVVLSPWAGPHGDGCACPEALTEWTAYPDTARGAPDFFRKTSIRIQEVVACDRGVHLFFRAKQAGKSHDACLVIGEPTLEHGLRRLPADSIPSDADFERMVERLEWDRGIFGERMRRLRAVLRQPEIGNHRARFKTGWFETSPRILPGSPIQLQWDGQAVDLIGVVDVYFRE